MIGDLPSIVRSIDHRVATDVFKYLWPGDTHVDERENERPSELAQAESWFVCRFVCELNLTYG